MTIVITTVSVNAAFLQEIKDDNRELKHLFAQTAEIAFNPSTTGSSTRHLTDLIIQLRDQLAMHFSLEEAFGYLDDAIAVAPRLSELAETLRSEHTQLFAVICDLAEHAEQLLHHERAAHSIDYILQELSSFCRKFQIHETRENELILQSLYDDIGVGD